MPTAAALESFEAIHATFRPRVRRYLARLLGPVEADDATQEVFEKVSRHLQEFRGEAHLSTWIFRIARHTAWDRLRAEAARRRRGGSPSGLDPTADAAPRAESAAAPLDEALARDEMNACLRDLIGDLPEPYRTVLYLSEFEGLPNREVAERLGVSLGAVKIRLHRARARMRRLLGSRCRIEADPDGELVCEPKPVS